jgi:hypothetical protein
MAAMDITSIPGEAMHSFRETITGTIGLINVGTMQAAGDISNDFVPLNTTLRLEVL